MAEATRAGVGFSENPDPTAAGIEAVRAALDEAGSEGCDLVIMFATSRHDPAVLTEAVRSVIGSTPLVGGNAVGVMTNGSLGYEGYQVAVAAISSPTLAVDAFVETGIADREYEVGLSLGKRVRDKQYTGDPNILVMYDSVKKPLTDGLALNMATPLIQGMSESLGVWSPAAGMGLLGDLQWSRGGLWGGDTFAYGGALALVLSGGVQLDTAIMHGCKPAGPYHTITKADGPVVLEIDGKAALDFIDDTIGGESAKCWEDYPLLITLGVNRGDKFGEFTEADYANRLCLAIDTERRGLVMFEPDLVAGSEIQIMHRSRDFGYVAGRTSALFDAIGDRRPLLALYIDCAGRASVLSSSEGEEADEVRRCIGDRVPLLGMYSGVEMAKVGETMRALDWTGVLCLFSE